MKKLHLFLIYYLKHVQMFQISIGATDKNVSKPSFNVRIWQNAFIGLGRGKMCEVFQHDKACSFIEPSALYINLLSIKTFLSELRINLANGFHVAVCQNIARTKECHHEPHSRQMPH